MKKLMLLLCLLVSVQAHAQMTLSGKIAHAGPGEAVLINVPFDNWYYKQNTTPAPLNAQGEFSISLPVKKPQTIFLDFAGTRYHLYGEPGKSLVIQADARQFGRSLKFKGDLGPENTFRSQTGLTFYTLHPQTWNDTTTAPGEILTALQESKKQAREKLFRIKSKNQAFVQMTQADIDYFIPGKIIHLIYKNKVWATGHTPTFHQQQWREALIAAYANLLLSCDDAVASYHYQQTITYYPKYLEWKDGTKEAFAKTVEAIMGKPFAEARQEIRAKGKTFWNYTVMHHALQGLALESALTSLINNGIASGELSYLGEMYTDFINRFPASIYRPHLERIMQPFWASQQGSAGREVQLDASSAQYKSLDEILAAHRGRVVYVDMWGSWCGPCREQFAHQKSLKERFRGKPVDFVYIAFENSARPQKTWQETILFYNLAGRHILGSADLRKHLGELYKDQGALRFPSYLLIDKAGNIVNQQAAQPSSGEKLYRQIEEIL
jgi:thiol-disulfide isomerase/thioredoxin